MIDLKPDGNQTRASHHCNFPAPDMETTFRAGGANVTHLSSLLGDMAVALIFNFCFFLSKVSCKFCWYWLSGDADKMPAFSRAWTVPRSSTERALCGNVHVFFFPSDTFQQGLVPGFSEKLSRWLKITLWPEGYGLLKESCLKKQTGKTQTERVVLSCLQQKEHLVAEWWDTLYPSQWIYLNSNFLNSGEESSVWREFLCSRVQNFCIQRAGQTACLHFPRECVARSCLAASDSQYFPLQSRLLPPPVVSQLPVNPSRQFGCCHSQDIFTSPCPVCAIIPAFAKQKRIWMFLHFCWTDVLPTVLVMQCDCLASTVTAMGMSHEISSLFLGCFMPWSLKA